jgi:hypothetical protein
MELLSCLRSCDDTRVWCSRRGRWTTEAGTVHEGTGPRGSEVVRERRFPRRGNRASLAGNARPLYRRCCYLFDIRGGDSKGKDRGELFARRASRNTELTLWGGCFFFEVVGLFYGDCPGASNRSCPRRDINIGFRDAVFDLSCR